MEEIHERLLGMGVIGSSLLIMMYLVLRTAYWNGLLSEGPILPLEIALLAYGVLYFLKLLKHDRYLAITGAI